MDTSLRLKPITVGATLFAIGLISIVVLADTHHLGFLHPVYDFPGGDKVGHFTLYGILTYLVARSWGARSLRRALLVGLAVAFVVALEELSQVWLPARSADWLDLIASLAGISVGLVAAAQLHPDPSARL